MKKQAITKQFEQVENQYSLNGQKLIFREFSPIEKQNNQNSQKSKNNPPVKQFQAILNESYLKVQWTEEQQLKLIEKHRQLGNRWALISQFLTGKNDNCVKNHFYSRLRKMVRKLNRMIQNHFKKSLKIIPNATIYKLVEASQQRFKQKPVCSSQVSLQSQDAITKMLHISFNQESLSQGNSPEDLNQLNQYKQLIQQIYQANHNYKKKSKRIKNSTIKAPLRTKKPRKPSLTFLQLDQNYRADQSQSFSQKLLQFQKSPQEIDKDKQKIDNENKNKVVSDFKINDKKVQVKEGEQMQELLKNIGLLKQRCTQKKVNYEVSERGDPSMRSFSDFQNQSQGFSLMDDSNNCWGKQEKMFCHLNRQLFGENGQQYENI